MLARAANGALVPVPVAPAGSVHATTQTSPAAATAGASPAGQPVTYVKTASGNVRPGAPRVDPANPRHDEDLMMRLLEHHAFRAMGTTCGVGVTTTLAELPTAHRAIAAAVAEVSACELALSRFDADSELSRLNAAGGAWTDAGPRLLGALAAAVDAREETRRPVRPGGAARARRRRLRPVVRASSSRAPPGPRSGGAREPPSRSITPAPALGSSRARRSTSAASERASRPTAQCVR